MAGLFGAIMRPSNTLIEGLSWEAAAEMFRGLYGGGVTRSGVVVNHETALRFTTVLICLRVLAESVASLPCILYQRRKDGGKDRADGQPLYKVLHDQANGWMTAFEYTEGMMTNLATRGNGYAYVERNSKAQCIGLVPLWPDGVDIQQASDWSPIYRATMPDNVKTKLSTSEMHHIRGPLPKGFYGRSMIHLARDGIGLGLAAEGFGAHFFSNGARPSGVLEHPKSISDPAQTRLKAQFSEKQQGYENAGSPLFLEEGMKWIAQSITPTDAQFIETRKFQRSEICGIFRVPAHFVNDLERATFSNIEHQSLDFVIHSLRPWLVRWEQAISRDCLSPAEKTQGFFAEFNLDGLLRGDFITRMKGYALQIQNGIANPNECRGRENMNPYDGGDEYWKPVNMQTTEEAKAALDAALNDNSGAAPPSSKE